MESRRPSLTVGRPRVEAQVKAATRSVGDRLPTQKRTGPSTEPGWFSGRLLHRIAAQLERLGGRVDRLTGAVRTPMVSARARMRRLVDELRRGNLFTQHP